MSFATGQGRSRPGRIEGGGHHAAERTARGGRGRAGHGRRGRRPGECRREGDRGGQAVQPAATITVVAEAGLQALLDKQYTGPEWEKLTGIKVNVVELHIRGDLSQDHPRAAGRHRRLRRAADLAGVARRLGRQRCGRCRSTPTSRSTASSPSSTTSIRPSRTGCPTTARSTASSSTATSSSPTTARICSRIRRTRPPSRRSTATISAPPKDYKQFGDIACFLTEKYQPDMYGAGVINTGYMFFFFSERFRNDGGRFFDPGDDEGDRQLRCRGQGADRDGRAEQVHGAGHRDLGLRRRTSRRSTPARSP